MCIVKLPKESSKYNLSQIYLTMKSDFFKAFFLMNSVLQDTHQESPLVQPVCRCSSQAREQSLLDHPISLQMHHLDLESYQAVVQC